MSFKLDLDRQEEAIVLNRPQEPQAPFPAVILISGSGGQNRDEEIFGHKPFKLIAFMLASFPEASYAWMRYFVIFDPEALTLISEWIREHVD